MRGTALQLAEILKDNDVQTESAAPGLGLML
jgi:hypothetical protein